MRFVLGVDLLVVMEVIRIHQKPQYWTCTREILEGEDDRIQVRQKLHLEEQCDDRMFNGLEESRRNQAVGDDSSRLRTARTLLRLLPGPAQCFLKVLRMIGEQRLVDVILRFGVANFDHCHGAFAHDSARAIVS
jgi:hypothetical protein